MDGAVIKQMLNNRIKEVCGHLLPNGKESRGEWLASNVNDISSKGSANTGSLRVALLGDKVGMWIDHADTSQNGDIIGLWMACRKVDFRSALREASDFVGYKSPKSVKFKQSIGHKTPTPKRERLPEKEADFLKPIEEGSRPWEWLTDERGISEEAIRAYGIGQGKYPYDKKSPLCVIFPFIDSMGEIQMLKWRDPDNKDYIRTTAKSNKVLFGIPAIPENQSSMFLTEGELDALTMYDMGYPAVSVPFGAKVANGDNDPNSEWIEHDYDNWIALHTEIIFAGDSDEVGRAATESIARRLGRDKCRMINWPDGIKDANEFIQKGFESSEFTETLLNEASDMDPDSLKSAKDFRSEIWECFFPSDDSKLGDPVPFGGDFPFRFRPGEITVWTGYSKHGKTILLNFMLVHLTQYNKRSCLCSLEMKPEKNLQAIIKMGLAKLKPSDEQEFDFGLNWASNYFWIYDKVGTATPEEVIEVFSYAAKKYGITHFVIDSLMRLDIPEDEDGVIKHLMNRLCDFATTYNVHVHLVAHSKKPDMKRPETRGWPNKHMVRGSVHITNIAHNVVVVWRNKAKEESYYKGVNTGNMSVYDSEWKDKSDATFAVLAQRENGEEPVRNLWFHKESQHYTGKGELPIIYAK
tara:strand:+ start:2453 stop:4363 length:1911 start_codon:yes stop_codon:yes gene_type:complete